MPGSGQGTPITGVQTVYEAQPFFTAVWIWDNSASAWVDRTNAARASTDAAFAILEDPNDRVYLGSESRFDLAGFLLTVVGALGAITVQYYTGSWVTFVGAYEYAFTASGAEGFENLSNWVSLAFSAGTPHAGAPPDARSRYWVRFQAASVTTAPTVSQIQARPYAAYCTPTDVARQLQLSYDFDGSTTPTRATVEDYIHAAQAYIDHSTQRSWRLNYKSQEHQEFNISGIKLLEGDIIAVTRVEIWNGGGWDLKVEGRTSDYFYVPDIGMVYFSRYFMLPARLQTYTAPAWMWGAGEFQFPVRISYLYGRNRFTNEKDGGVVFDITRKLAAIDTLMNHDYSILTVSGGDKVAMDRKIDLWKIDTEEKLDRLRRWVIL